MTLSDSTIALIALWLIPGLGPVRIKKLLKRFSSVETIFDASSLQLSEALELDKSITSLIPRALEADRLKRELALIERHQIEIIDFTTDKYPGLLKEIYSAPPILYKKGVIDLGQGFPLGFVGSRKASYAGKNSCQKLIKELSVQQSNTVVVSGLAIGIDSVAHNAALDNNLKTIAVLANGLSTVYPVRNEKLAEKICLNGALVTEFPMTVKPTPSNFPLRNRIISGLSKGVVVVEAGERSGASITAGYTLEQNRELFALPGLADSKFHKGSNRLIQKGQAKLIMTAKDILEEFGPFNFQLSNDDVINNLPTSVSDLNEEEQKVLEILEYGPVQKDTIAGMTGIPIKNLLPVLTNLELKGLIISKPGAVYQKSGNLD